MGGGGGGGGGGIVSRECVGEMESVHLHWVKADKRARDVGKDRCGVARN